MGTAAMRREHPALDVSHSSLLCPLPHPGAGRRVSLRLEWLVPSSGAAVLERALWVVGTEASPSLASGQQGCTGTCSSKNGFSFLLQTPIQQQRWLRQTLCLFPWARGRYVLTAPVFCLSLCAGREQGEGQSPSSGARKSAQWAVR